MINVNNVIITDFHVNFKLKQFIKMEFISVNNVDMKIIFKPYNAKNVNEKNMNNNINHIEKI